MEAGSSAATIQIEDDSHLTMNSTHTGNINVNTRSSLTVNGTLDGNINYNTSGTGLIGETGTVDGNLTANRTSSVIVNGTVTGTLRAGQDASVTLNGTVNTKFDPDSTAMQYIGEDGTLNGEIQLNGSDQMTVAGSVNGRFSINQTAQVIIEATANIRSNSPSSWIFNTPSVQWNVGADGSVGTLRTNHNETSSDAYDGVWRYSNGDVDVVVDLTDCEVYGSSITLQLVSGIENESTFADNVTFLYDGAEVTGFTWDGAGSGSFSGTLANPAPDADNDGVADVDDAFPNDPNETADSDGDSVGDNADAFPNDPNETVDTDGDSVGDNSDQHNGLDDTVINNALGIATADGKINLSAWLATNSYIVDDGSSGGTSGYTEQQLIDLRVGSQLASIDNDQATLQVVIEQSADLISWSPLKTENVTVDAPAGTPKLFFRYRMQD